MIFDWPEALWLLLAVPLLVAGYLWLSRRRRLAAIRYPNMAVVRQAMGPMGAWRRHVPAAILLTAVIVLIVAVARPATVLTLPVNGATVMLAMDVSASMGATDIDPNRLAAAQQAAKQFVAGAAGNVQIGIVAFATTALLVQPPTMDRAALDAAIDSLELGRGTAVGDGLLVALQTIFADQKLKVSVPAPDASIAARTTQLLDADGSPEHPPALAGSYETAIVVLLTDGATTAGSDPLAAAQTAADYGVRVYTVGFGSASGGVIELEGSSMRAKPDSDALREIAEKTRAQYFDARSAVDLAQIYQSLSARHSTKTALTEISFILAGIAAGLAVAASTLSMLWLGRAA